MFEAARKCSGRVLVVATSLCFAASTVFGGWLEKIQDPIAMKKYLESHVIAPFSIGDIKEYMEAEGFTCSVRKDSVFKKHMKYLYCTDQVERPKLALWEVAFEIKTYRGQQALAGEVAVIKTYPKNR
jgi:hypothetical protein